MKKIFAEIVREKKHFRQKNSKKIFNIILAIFLYFEKKLGWSSVNFWKKKSNKIFAIFAIFLIL